MPAGKLVFAQIFESIHPEQFRRCVDRYGGNYKTSSFSCWDQYLAMAFAQITFRESLADLEVCLRSRPDQLYHLGFRSKKGSYLTIDTKDEVVKITGWRGRSGWNTRGRFIT